MTRSNPSDIRVLLVGNDNTLLWSRELVLKQAGYRVRSAFASEALAVGFEEDVVVLCRSVGMQAAESLAVALKANHPASRILRLSSSVPAIHDAYFDAVCDPTTGPAKMLAELAKLIDMSQTN